MMPDFPKLPKGVCMLYGHPRRFEAVWCVPGKKRPTSKCCGHRHKTVEAARKCYENGPPR